MLQFSQPPPAKTLQLMECLVAYLQLRLPHFKQVNHYLPPEKLTPQPHRHYFCCILPMVSKMTGISYNLSELILLLFFFFVFLVSQLESWAISTR